MKPNPRKAILNVGEILQESVPAPAGDAGKYFDQNPSASSKKYVLSDKLWRYLREYAAKHKKAGNGFGYGLANLEGVTRTLSARYHKDGSEILIPSKGSRNPRRLTPRECARLMGFPDHFSIPVSDTQAYRQFGNSVAVPVVSAIAKEIVRSLR